MSAVANFNPQNPHAQNDAQFDDELMKWALKDDQEAFHYNRQLHHALHMWDDVHDRDVTVAPETVDVGLFRLFMELPHHPFARRFPSVQPVLVSSTLAWMAANRLEKQGIERSLDMSYSLRCHYLQVLHYSAYLIGGIEWAAEVGEKLWSDGGLESLDQYKEEHRRVRRG